MDLSQAKGKSCASIQAKNKTQGPAIDNLSLGWPSEELGPIKNTLLCEIEKHDGYLGAKIINIRFAFHRII